MKTACIGLLLALQKRYLSFLVTRGMLVSGPTHREVNANGLLREVHAAEERVEARVGAQQYNARITEKLTHTAVLFCIFLA